MASEAFTLAILLTLKDGASGGLDRFEARLRAAGKTGEGFLKQYEQIREDLSKDLAIGGVGVAGLKILKDGIQVAGDYQSVMTDLRSSLAQTGADGQINLNKLATEMMGAEAVAVRLGNKLPGTTADFAQMMQAMKQNGLDAKTIIDGAADAVGNLAVANNMKPVDLAGDFARYGNLFKLRPEDFTPAADVMSRIYSSTGQTTAELIEAAKYFQGRAGQGLGIGGLQDAEKYTRLFGFLGKQGMTGSMAGMGLTNFFTAYNQHKDKLVDLQKATGIKLDFFDKKGKFVGLDAVMDQMAQFDKLSAKDRTQWMDEIFGTLGAGVGNVMIDTNGWKQFNEEQNKTISLQDKTNLKSKDFNMQMEALGGTLTNLKVAVFEQMLPDATALVAKTNDLVGAVQQFVKLHPDLAKYSVAFLGIGSASIVAYSGIKTVSRCVQLLKLASAFKRGKGLPGLLDQTTAATERVTRTQAGFVRQNDVVSGGLIKTGNSATAAAKGMNGFAGSTVTADTKVAGLRRNLFSLGNFMKFTLLLETIGFTWDQINQLREISGKATVQNREADALGKQSYNLFKQQKAARWFGIGDDKQIADLTKKNPAAAATYQLLKPDSRREAASVTSLMQMGNDNIQKSLDPTRKNAVDIGMDWGKILMGKSLIWDGEVAPNSPLLGKRKEREEFYASQPARGGKWGAIEYAAMGILPAITPLLFTTKVSPQQLADREIRGANYLQQRAPSLADPQVMRSFRLQEMPKMNLTSEMTQDLNNMLKMAFPDSFAQSMTGMFDQGSQAFAQAIQTMNRPIADFCTVLTKPTDPMQKTTDLFLGIQQPLTDSGTNLGKIVGPAERIPGAFTSILNSASSIALQMDGVATKVGSFQMPNVAGVAGNNAQGVNGNNQGRPAPKIPFFLNNFGAGKATGAFLTGKGLEYVHANEEITPAKSVAFRDHQGQRLISALSAVNYLAELQNKNLSYKSADGIVREEFSSFVNNSPFSLTNSFPMPSTSNAGNTATFALAVPRRGSSPAAMPANVKPAIQTFSTVRTDPSFRLSAGDDRRLGNTSSLLDLTRRTDDRRSDFSSIANFSNLQSESRNDSRRSESRFNFDERLLERADRAANVASGVSNTSSSEGAVTINAPLTLNITAGSGGLKETEAVVKKALEQHVKKIEATVNEHMAAKRLDRRLARFSDNGRLRM